MEQTDEFAYLDITVIRNTEESIDFLLYNKPTSSRQWLNYRSNHPMNQKLNVVYNLIKRMYTLRSPKYQHECTINIRKVLKAIDYPTDLIEKRIKEYLSAQNSRQVPATPLSPTTFNGTNDQDRIKYKGLHFHSSCSPKHSKNSVHQKASTEENRQLKRKYFNSQCVQLFLFWAARTITCNHERSIHYVCFIYIKKRQTAMDILNNDLAYRYCNEKNKIFLIHLHSTFYTERKRIIKSCNLSNWFILYN